LTSKTASRPMTYLRVVTPSTIATPSRPDEVVPVLKDEDPVEQPNDAEDPDSDETLGMLHRHSVSRSFHFPNSKILDAELGFRGYICLFLESPRGL
jgi:hypothetical protein